MSEKRKDNKGRILRTGERQRSDGQYLYTYKGKDGKNKFVYSWKLEPTDKLPEGKRSSKSLRELEQEIQNPLMRKQHIRAAMSLYQNWLRDILQPKQG